MFAGTFDENCIRHLKSYERLCVTYVLFDEDKFELLRSMLRAGALAFYDGSTRAMGMPHRGIMLAFNAKYASPTRREENSKIFGFLSLTSTRGA